MVCWLVSFALCSLFPSFIPFYTNRQKIEKDINQIMQSRIMLKKKYNAQISCYINTILIHVLDLQHGYIYIIVEGEK